MINLDSDSDDEFNPIPSVKNLKELFDIAQRQAIAQTRDDKSQKDLVSKKKKKNKTDDTMNSKKDLAYKKKITKIVGDNGACLKKSMEPCSSKKTKPTMDISMSEETEELLAEIAELTSSIPKPLFNERSTLEKSLIPPLIIDSVPEPAPNLSSSRGRSASRRGRSSKNTRAAARKLYEAEEQQLAILNNDIRQILDDPMISDYINDDITAMPEVELEKWPVHVRWKEEVLRFRVPKGTRFSKLRMEIANKVSVRADNIVVMNKDSEEIPDNVLVEELKFGLVIDAFPKPEVGQSKVEDAKSKQYSDPDTVLLKVQGCGGHRSRMEIAIKRTTHIKQLLDDYIQKFGLEGKQFKLIFDGDTVDLEETPESLDLDGGEMFDIVEL